MAIENLNVPTDWFEEVCQQLDQLQQSADKYADENEIIPSSKHFSMVKEQLRNLRQLAEFPCLEMPDIWLSPNGEIGLTWDTGKLSFDLVFGSRFTARLTTGFDQKLIERKDVPSILRQFAA